MESLNCIEGYSKGKLGSGLRAILSADGWWIIHVVLNSISIPITIKEEFKLKVLKLINKSLKAHFLSLPDHTTDIKGYDDGCSSQDHETDQEEEPVSGAVLHLRALGQATQVAESALAALSAVSAWSPGYSVTDSTLAAPGAPSAT